jgi:hypothetical protein
MKSLLGTGALVLALGLGAWSSDAMSRSDEPDRPARQQRQQADDTGRPDAKGMPPGQQKQADREKKSHPHGAPPGLEQRERGGPPPWSGGPGQRTEEPPGLGKQGRGD